MAEARANAAAGNGRNIVVLRLSYADLGGSRSNRKDNKSIYQFLRGYESIPELAGCLVIADKSEKAIPDSATALKQKINWSSATYWQSLTDRVPIVVVIDQTSSRSTEWRCHDRVSAYHDFRNTIIFSTVSQAQERINHYVGKVYTEFQKIKVYGHMKTFLLSAGRIDYAEYMRHDWKARKADRRSVASEVPLYQIVSTTTGNSHPDYPRLLPQAEADAALQELACFADVKVSPRVRGTVRAMRVFKTEFFPCEESGFARLKATLDARFSKVFQDPFVRSRRDGYGPNEEGKWRGVLRGYKVLDYESNVVTQPGWGVGPNEPRLTICYRGATLGVALRYDTKQKIMKSTLEAFKSMYRN